jgi:methionine biosynthesis protein MetW
MNDNVCRARPDVGHQYHRDLSEGVVGKYAVVAAHLPPGSRVLELGCHTGYFSQALEKRGCQVIGVECDANAVAAAREQGLDVRYGNVEQPGFLEDLGVQFDAVLCMDVLEHLQDAVRVLERLKSVLKPSGRILCTGPNVAYWAVRKELLLGRWNYTDTGILDRTHLRFFTADSWCGLLEESGYVVENLQPAEGMFPLEGRLLKIPVLRLLVGPIRRWTLWLWPTMFAIVFFLEARPNSGADLNGVENRS